jgi:hypothetical protein
MAAVGMTFPFLCVIRSKSTIFPIPPSKKFSFIASSVTVVCACSIQMYTHLHVHCFLVIAQGFSGKYFVFLLLFSFSMCMVGAIFALTSQHWESSVMTFETDAM